MRCKDLQRIDPLGDAADGCVLCLQGGDGEGECQVPRQRHGHVPAPQDTALRPGAVQEHVREDMRAQHPAACESPLLCSAQILAVLGDFRQWLIASHPIQQKNK